MKQRTVLITGATGGIGQAIASRFAKEGYRIVIHYNKNLSAADQLKEALNDQTDVYVVGGDLTNLSELDGVVSFLSDHKLTVDVLINNAGIKSDAPVDDMGDDVFASVLRTNVEGPWYLTKRLVPAMKKQGYGRIINITSGVAKEGRANQSNYAASKAALDNLTKSLARELGADGITVNSVAPGLIETNMTKDVSDEHKQAYIERVPIKRLVKAKDVAQACVFFASEDSGAISGQILGVNGGLR